MTARDADEAVANANSHTSYDTGMCQQFVRGPCWEVPAVFGSAIEAWDGARHKHPGDRNPPKGAPCFYRGGQYGHVVIAKADPVRSTDTPSTGRVGDTALDHFERAWGYTYLGWTEDLNGYDLPLGGGDDDMNLGDEITEWSPDDGATGDTTVGKTLNQARGYAEDTYERVKRLEKDVAKILDKLG
jgi:hypothetical protein